MVFLEGFINLLFPPYCPLCGKDVLDQDGGGFCKECTSLLIPIREPLCPGCSIPYPGSSINHFCQECSEKKRYYDRGRCLFIYDGKIKEAFHLFKYAGRRSLINSFEKLIPKQIPSPLGKYDLIIPVPLHRNKLRKRGFNQSLLIAHAVGKLWGIHVNPFILKKIKDTPPQTGLSYDERAENLKEAFFVSNPRMVINKNILLVDDVFTTGFTIQECARALKKSGVNSVDFFTIARTI